MKGRERPGLLDSPARREPAPDRRRLDGPTAPTVPIAQRSEAMTIVAPLPSPRASAEGAPRGPARPEGAAPGAQAPPRRDPAPGRSGGTPPDAWPRRLAAYGLVVALAACAGAGFGPLFGFAGLRPVAVAAAVPVMLVAALSWRGRPAPFALSVLAWAVGFVVAAAVTLGSGGLPERLALVRGAVLGGPARLLDVAVPAPADPDLLCVPLLVVWLAAAGGAELVGRTRTRLLPAAPAVVGLALASAASAAAPGANLGPAVALAGLAALLVLARPPRTGGPGDADAAVLAVGTAATDGRITVGPSRPGRLPGAARAAAAVAVVLAAAVAGGAWLPGLVASAPPVDPRAYRSMPVRPVDAVSPLSALADWTAHPDQSLFTLRLRGQGAGPVPLRLAVLADFDGAVWDSPSRYTRVGASVPPPSGAAAATAGEVTQRLTVTGLTGQLLPVLARPVEVGGADGYAADLDSGLLMRGEPVARGQSFTVVSAPAAALSLDQLAALTTADPADARRDAPYLALPDDVPPVLRALAHVAAGQGIGPFQQAALLQRYLASNFRFDPTAPPGHTLAHIETFVADTRRGTSEQFATTFVLAARVLGLPSRVVVGFAPSTPGTGPASVTVTGHEALAWAEVRFDGVGWLPFFPTPAASGAQGAALAGSSQGESAAQAAAVDAAVRAGITAPVDPPPAAAEAPASTGGAAGLVRVLGLVAAAAAAVALGYLALAYARPVARARRRLATRGRPRQRVVLAWEHALDALAAVGVSVPVSASPAEVVGLGARLFGGEPRAGAGVTALRGLADLATLALFGPDDPAGDTGQPGAAWSGAAGEHAAQEARRLALEVGRAAARVVPRRRRLAVRLRPARVLGRGPAAADAPRVAV